jgi:hypothetical protein
VNTKYIFTSKYENKDDVVTIMWCQTSFEAERMRVAMSRTKDVIEVTVEK